MGAEQDRAHWRIKCSGGLLLKEVLAWCNLKHWSLVLMELKKRETIRPPCLEEKEARKEMMVSVLSLPLLLVLIVDVGTTYAMIMVLKFFFYVEYTSNLKIDHSSLASSYHGGIISGFALISSTLSIAAESGGKV